MVSVDVKCHDYLLPIGAQELRESRGDRPRLPVLNSPYGFCGKATLEDLPTKPTVPSLPAFTVSAMALCVFKLSDSHSALQRTSLTTTDLLKNQLKKSFCLTKVSFSLILDSHDGCF